MREGQEESEEFCAELGDGWVVCFEGWVAVPDWPFEGVDEMEEGWVEVGERVEEQVGLVRCGQDNVSVQEGGDD